MHNARGRFPRSVRMNQNDMKCYAVSVCIHAYVMLYIHTYIFCCPVFYLYCVVFFSNDVVSVVVCLQGTFRNCQGYFNQSMKLGVRIPLGNTPRAFFDFRDLTYFVAYRRPSCKSDFCHLRANGCSYSVSSRHF
jgi:hypothetical protein